MYPIVRRCQHRYIECLSVLRCAKIDFLFCVSLAKIFSFRNHSLWIKASELKAIEHHHNFRPPERKKNDSKYTFILIVVGRRFIRFSSPIFTITSICTCVLLRFVSGYVCLYVCLCSEQKQLLKMAAFTTYLFDSRKKPRNGKQQKWGAKTFYW